MPIASINRTPFGQVPAAQSVEPRASVISPEPQALETAAQRKAQAALTEFRAASEIGEAGRELSQVSVAFLKPLDDLRKAEQVLASNQVAVDAILEVRQVARTAQTDGTPHQQYMDVLTASFDQIQQRAQQQARAFGAAGVAHVSEQLASERLKLFSEGQQYTFTERTADQLGNLARQDAYYRQQILGTTDPAERAKLTQEYIGIYNVAAATNLLKPADAFTKQEDFGYFVVGNTAIQIGRTAGVDEAEKYLQASGVDPTRQQQFLTSVIRDRSLEFRREADAEREKARAVQAEQDIQEGLLRRRLLDKDVTVAEIDLIRKQAVDMLKEGKLRGSGEQTIQMLADSQAKEKTNPVKMRDNEQTKQELLIEVIQNPAGTSDTAILTKPDLTSDTKIQLLNIHQGRLNANHYRNDAHFKRRVEELQAFKNLTDPYQKTNQAGQTGIVPSHNAIVEAYISEYVLMVDKASQASQGVLTRQQILEFDDEVEGFKVAIQQQKWPKSTPPSQYYGKP